MTNEKRAEILETIEDSIMELNAARHNSDSTATRNDIELLIERLRSAALWIEIEGNA